MKKLITKLAVIILLLFTGISCSTDSNDNGNGIPPTIIVENVTTGGTLTLPQEEGISFHLTLTDEVGLSTYTVTVEGTDIQVSESISGLEHSTSIEVTGLSTGETYSVAIVAKNTEGLQSNFNFNLILSEDPPFANLYLVGNATPAGWNIENPTPMDINPDNPWIFEFEGDLTQGEFKISTFTGDWCDDLEWIRPLEMHPPNTERDYIITTGCPPDEEDYKWFIGDAGVYSISIDLENETIDIELLEEAEGGYQDLYLVGDATPGGWSLDDKTPFTADESNPLVFTWTGDLVEGNFKISTNSADFGSGDWIHPVSHAQVFSVKDFVIINYGTEDHDDNQWVVGEEEAGTFTITIDLEAEEIHFELE